MNKLKSYGIIAAAIAFSTLAGNQVQANNNLPSDIREVPDYAKASVEEMFERGKLVGFTDGTFKPNKELTRAEFVAMIMRAYDVVPRDSLENVIFSDENEMTDWESGVMKKAFRAGLITGTSMNYDWDKGIYSYKLDPRKHITREEVAAIMSNATYSTLPGYVYYTEYNKVGLEESFPKDHNDISGWAYGSVRALKEAGLMNGISTTSFGPKKTSTRVESALLMDRLEKKVENYISNLPEEMSLTKEEALYYNSDDGAGAIIADKVEDLHITNNNIGKEDFKKDIYSLRDEQGVEKDLEVNYYNVIYQDKETGLLLNKPVYLGFTDIEQEPIDFNINEEVVFQLPSGVETSYFKQKIADFLKVEVTDITLYETVYPYKEYNIDEYGNVIEESEKIMLHANNPVVLFIQPNRVFIKEVKLTIIN